MKRSRIFPCGNLLCADCAGQKSIRFVFHCFKTCFTYCGSYVREAPCDRGQWHPWPTVRVAQLEYAAEFAEKLIEERESASGEE
jgi:hypothetical protein